ncbi:MAG: lysophospholipid acyltransferase family protein [Tetrasphaera sp.]
MNPEPAQRHTPLSEQTGENNPLVDRVMRYVVLGPALRGLTRLSVRGIEHIPPEGQAAMIASNHLSFSDSMFITLASRRQVHFLGKAEYFQGTGVKGVLMRSFFRSFGTIPVERADARAAAESLQIAERILGEGGAFGIYPEGTRSRDGRLHRGRTGVARLALSTGAPIIPCAITGTDKVQPPDSRIPRPSKVTVSFGPPLDLAPLQAQFVKAKLLREITDAVMDAIGSMSRQERSGRYASDVNAELEASP